MTPRRLPFEVPVWPITFMALGVPRGEMEWKFHPDRKWRFDYAWPDRMLALEVEGGVWTGGRHTSGAGFMKDMEKYNEASVLGWTVLRCTPQQVDSGAAGALVLRALKGRGGCGS